MSENISRKFFSSASSHNWKSLIRVERWRKIDTARFAAGGEARKPFFSGGSKKRARTSVEIPASWIFNSQLSNVSSIHVFVNIFCLPSVYVTMVCAIITKCRWLFVCAVIFPSASNVQFHQNKNKQRSKEEEHAVLRSSARWHIFHILLHSALCSFAPPRLCVLFLASSMMM